MSRTVDVNVLLYASDASSPDHAAAATTLERLAAGPELLTLFWPTLIAYLRMATNPSIFNRPLTMEQAMGNVEALLARPNVRVVGAGDTFWRSFRAVADDARPVGNLVPDAFIAALMLEHGVSTIVTRDRDFRRFRHVRIEDLGEGPAGS
jgi:toxin-antitoxin system PIN domain toxin